MDSLFFVLIILDLVIITGVMGVQDKRFDENYAVTWGNEHVKFMNEGRDVELSMDPSSGEVKLHDTLFFGLLSLFIDACMYNI